jgi:hypothetical protein
MNLQILASGVAALAMLTLASASEPAQARHGGHGPGGGGGWAPRFSSVRHVSGPHHFAFRDFHRFHRFRHHRRFAYVDVYPYAYGDGCYWLRRRALYSGSPYWWRRYYACRHGYY